MQLDVLFLLLISGHLLGDFYLQPTVLAKGKAKNFLALLLHSVIYTISIVIFLLPYISQYMLWFLLVLFVSHIVVDWIKLQFLRMASQNTKIKPMIFIVDQIVHIAIIFVIAYIHANNWYIISNFIGTCLQDFWQGMQVNIEPETLLRYLLIFLIIGKPANCLIKEINHPTNIQKPYRQAPPLLKATAQETEYKNAGSLIGTLERILVAIMVILGQYAAVGLIFTAKSITRYDKITKEPSFAEYYLVGTLLSVLIAVVSALLLLPSSL